MSDADKPGEATSRRRSLLVEQLAELERVLDGIELEPERKNMLRAAGYRTCVGIAWQSAKKPEPAPLGNFAGTALLGLPPAQTPPAASMLPPAGPPAPGAQSAADTSSAVYPPPPLGGGGIQSQAGPWALHVKQQLEHKELTNASYAALCKLMGLEKGSGKYPSGEDCLLLTEQEACNIAQAQPQRKGGQKQGGGRWR